MDSHINISRLISISHLATANFLYNVFPFKSKQILEYHPQMLQEYLRGADQTSFMYPRSIPLSEQIPYSKITCILLCEKGSITKMSSILCIILEPNISAPSLNHKITVNQVVLLRSFECCPFEFKH